MTASHAAFNDAWDQYDSPIGRLDAGEIRDACGKAWNATRAATRAAALAHGEDPQNTNHISSWIRRADRRMSGFEIMPKLCAERVRFLHQEPCYDSHTGNEDIPDLIRETAEHIRQAQQLASL